MIPHGGGWWGENDFDAKAAKLVGVSRRTIYNWLASGKIEYVRTAGGSVRIFVDTLWRDANDSSRPAVQSMWQAEGRNQA
jgi:excisionase family DNA binding protein